MDELVVAGAGLAGLTAALTVRSEVGDSLEITVVGDESFAPPSVLMDDPDPVNVDLFLGEHGIDFIEGRLRSVRSQDKEIDLRETTISYDYLLIAERKRRSSPDAAVAVNGIEDIQKIRDEVRSTVRAGASYAVVGGGVTGAEMAAYLDAVLRGGDVRRIDTELRLFEQDELLPAFPKKASDTAREYLERHGVEVVEERVTDVTRSQLTAVERYDTDLTVWCGGRSAAFDADLDTDNGEVVVDRELNSVSDAVVYAAGDAITFPRMRHDGPRAGAPRNLLRQGRIAGWNIATLFTEDSRESYEPSSAPLWVNLQEESVLSWRNLVLSGAFVHGADGVRKWWRQRSFTV